MKFTAISKAISNFKACYNRLRTRKKADSEPHSDSSSVNLLLDKEELLFSISKAAVELDLVNRDITIPRFAVHADQSTGKTAFIDCIAGLKLGFSTGGGVGTRCPVQVAITRIPKGEEPIYFVGGKQVSNVFWVSKAVSDHMKALETSLQSSGFSDEILEVSIRHPEGRSCIIVDMPGVQRNPGPAVEAAQQIDLINAKYMRDPTFISILLNRTGNDQQADPYGYITELFEGTERVNDEQCGFPPKKNWRLTSILVSNWFDNVETLPSARDIMAYTRADRDSMKQFFVSSGVRDGMDKRIEDTKVTSDNINSWTTWRERAFLFRTMKRKQDWHADMEKELAPKLGIQVLAEHLFLMAVKKTEEQLPVIQEATHKKLLGLEDKHKKVTERLAATNAPNLYADWQALRTDFVDRFQNVCTDTRADAAPSPNCNSGRTYDETLVGVPRCPQDDSIWSDKSISERLLGGTYNEHPADVEKEILLAKLVHKDQEHDAPMLARGLDLKHDPVRAARRALDIMLFKVFTYDVENTFSDHLRNRVLESENYPQAMMTVTRLAARSIIPLVQKYTLELYNILTFPIDGVLTEVLGSVDFKSHKAELQPNLHEHISSCTKSAIEGILMDFEKILIDDLKAAAAIRQDRIQSDLMKPAFICLENMLPIEAVAKPIQARLEEDHHAAALGTSTTKVQRNSATPSFRSRESSQPSESQKCREEAIKALYRIAFLSRSTLSWADYLYGGSLRILQPDPNDEVAALAYTENTLKSYYISIFCHFKDQAAGKLQIQTEKLFRDKKFLENQVKRISGNVLTIESAEKCVAPICESLLKEKVDLEREIAVCKDMIVQFGRLNSMATTI